MGTIVQDYGPIYGEAVNGTVQGRPNGSVFVPLSNLITLSVNPGDVSISAGHIYIASKSKVAAVAQDLASYIQCQVFSDSACTTQIAGRIFAAGSFNIDGLQYFAQILGDPPEVGDTVYLRAQLFSSTGVAVATSDVVSREVAA